MSDKFSKWPSDESETGLLSAIVKSSDDAIISKDLDSIITSWNEGAERIFGYTAEEAVGRPITMLFPEDRIDEEEEIISRIRKGERVDHYETVRMRKDGTLLDVSLTISPVKDSEGNIVGASKIVRDITVQKEAQKKLRKNRNRLRTVLEIETVGVVFWGGDDFTIMEANDAFLEMSGFNCDEVLGKGWREMTPEEFYPVSKRAVADLKAIGYTKPYEKQYVRKDGTRWWGLSAPRRIDDNEVVEFLLDITEQKEAEQELEAMNENLEKRVEERTASLLSYQEQLRSLASQLSMAEEQERQRLATELHDNLGQMLAVGKMKIDLLQKKQPAETASSEIDKLQELMDDALTYTRELMSDLKPPPSLHEEDLRTSIRWLAKKMEKHEVEVTIQDDGQPKKIDEEIQVTLLQCVRELLFNVVKHTSEKKADIRLKYSEDKLFITVKDEGEGFDTDRVKLAPSDNGGFGLFNIHERIDLLGGRVDINSEVGEGTEVTMYIPLNEKDQMEKAIERTKEARQIKQVRERKKDEQGIKILLVDDHKMVREGLRKIIDDHDDIVVVGEASDGEEAIKLSQQISPDVILMDINMPGTDGIKATQRIHADMPDIRIIGLSLHEDKDVIRDMRSAGASAYLTKAEALESLIVTIRTEASALEN